MCFDTTERKISDDPSKSTYPSLCNVAMRFFIVYACMPVMFDNLLYVHFLGRFDCIYDKRKVQTQ